MTKTKPFFERVKESAKENFNALTTLVKMQLKEKMDMSFTRSKRKMIFKLSWLVIEFAGITAIIYAVFYFLKLLSLFSLVHDIPVSVIAIVFSVMLGLSVVTDTLGLMKALYFSKDNTVLLTFPATPSLIFFSKLATYYIYELRKSFMFTIPMFIAYGIAKNYSLIYYPWLIFMFVLISVVPVLISAMLSIPSMFVYVFLNRVKVLQYILYTTAVAIGIIAVWYTIGLIPEDINFVATWGQTFWDIQDFLKAFTVNFAPLYMFTELIVGKTVGLSNVIFHANTIPSLLVLIGIALALLALCFLCSKPLFCKMASTPFEFKKKNSIRTKSNKQHSPFMSALKKELTSGIRSNALIKHAGITVVALPMIIFLLNTIYAAMNTRLLGSQMAVCFNLLIMLLVVMLTNIDIASVYSRDGASSYLNKVQPASYTTLLFSKLFFPLAVTLLGVSLTTAVFASFATLPIIDSIMLGIVVFMIYTAHLFSSAESDIMNPQYEQYATFNDQANNPNETTAGVFAILTSVTVFIIALFLSSNSTSGLWFMLALAATVFAAAKVGTYIMKIKAFYKEKQ